MHRAWTVSLVRPKQWKRDMRFGTLNVSILYRSCSFATVAGQLIRNKLDLGVQAVKWDKGDTVGEGDYTLFCKRKRKSSIGNRFFCSLRNIISS